MIKTIVNKLGMWENNITETIDICLDLITNETKSYILPTELQRQSDRLQYQVRVPGSTLGILSLEINDKNKLVVQGISFNNTKIKVSEETIQTLDTFVGEEIEIPNIASEFINGTLSQLEYEKIINTKKHDSKNFIPIFINNEEALIKLENSLYKENKDDECLKVLHKTDTYLIGKIILLYSHLLSEYELKK